MADMNPDDAWAGLIDPALLAWNSVYAPVTNTPDINTQTATTTTTTTTKATRSSKRNPGKRLKPQPQDPKDMANNDGQDKGLTKQHDNFEKRISEIKKEMTQMKQSMKQQQVENACLLKKNDELEKRIAENKKEMQKIKAKVVELDQIVLPTQFNLSGFFSRTTVRYPLYHDKNVTNVNSA
jgi:regulator of replication initiation timing